MFEYTSGCAEVLVAGLGWKRGCAPTRSCGRTGAAEILGVEFTVPEAEIAEYLASMRQIADAEIAEDPVD